MRDGSRVVAAPITCVPGGAKGATCASLATILVTASRTASSEYLVGSADTQPYSLPPAPFSRTRSPSAGPAAAKALFHSATDSPSPGSRRMASPISKLRSASIACLMRSPVLPLADSSSACALGIDSILAIFIPLLSTYFVVLYTEGRTTPPSTQMKLTEGRHLLGFPSSTPDRRV